MAASRRMAIEPDRPEIVPVLGESVRQLPIKTELVNAASAIITNPQILVNVMRRRVRQLALGHRPMMEFAPGLGLADIALSEIAAGKISFESTLGQTPQATVVQFPGIIVDQKKEGKAA